MIAARPTIHRFVCCQSFTDPVVISRGFVRNCNSPYKYYVALEVRFYVFLKEMFDFVHVLSVVI